MFDGDDCLGWCQFGPPDELPRIKSRAQYEKGRRRRPTGGSRATSSARDTAARASRPRRSPARCELIAELGGGTVEGYPEAAGDVPAGFLFNGALSTYEQLGFARDRKIGKHRWVVTKGRRYPA